MVKNDKTKLGAKKTEYNFTGPDFSILDTFDNKNPEQIHLVTFTMERDEFTSLCPVTSQPDQAKIELIYIPNKDMLESKSWKLYLFSFRNHGAFHEDIVNRIANDIEIVLVPKYIRVFGDFSPRGGIAIKPIVEIWSEEVTIKENEQIKRLIETWDRKRK
jgi:7-cyano-7-deazaguanine reductase